MRPKRVILNLPALSAVEVFQNLIIVTAVLAVTISAPRVQAATKSYNVTATSSSFSPSTISVDKGDVVTLNFSVPSNDDYCCGLEVRSPKFSTITVQRGGSGSATFTADANFTFSSYWPASSVHKADGTVTVQSTDTPITAPSPSTNTNTNQSKISKPTVKKVQPGRFKRKTSGTFTMTIIGTKFAAGIKVKVGKVSASKVTRVSSTKIKAVIPRKNLASGKHTVTITNKDGGKASKKNAITVVP